MEEPIRLDKAIGVGLQLNCTADEVEESLEELKDLALTVGIDVVAFVYQAVKEVHPAHYVGLGKVSEIKAALDATESEIVIFDDPLTPRQIKNLEAMLGVIIMDRSFLILQIFAQNAKSSEAKLEVEYAQKKYMLPRLVGMNNYLSRQGGGSFNAKGAGETKLELDRRKIKEDLTFLENVIEKKNESKSNSAKKRENSNIPFVALVGYTNAGKSSTMNSLSSILTSNKEKVLEKDQLFATLSTKVKRIKKTNKRPFLLVDSIGFINKLPHELVNSFKSTLSEISGADLLLVVVDGSKYSQKKVEVTLDILDQLNISTKPKIFVLTHCDVPLKEELPIEVENNYMLISNVSKSGIEELIDKIYLEIEQNMETFKVKIPFVNGNLINLVKASCSINQEIIEEDGIIYELILSRDEIGQFKDYII